MTTESDLEQRIMQCIDDGLQALGDGGKKVIYYYLEKNFGLKRKEIPKNPEIFSKGLNSIFGEEGTVSIEKSIVEKLRRSFNMKQRSKITFVEVVAMIKVRQKSSRAVQ